MSTTDKVKPGDIVLLTPEFTAALHLRGCLMLVERISEMGLHGNIRMPNHPDGYVEYVAQAEEVEATGGHICLAAVA